MCEGADLTLKSELESVVQVSDKLLRWVRRKLLEARLEQARIDRKAIWDHWINGPDCNCMCTSGVHKIDSKIADLERQIAEAR